MAHSELSDGIDELIEPARGPLRLDKNDPHGTGRLWRYQSHGDGRGFILGQSIETDDTGEFFVPISRRHPSAFIHTAGKKS